MSGEKVAHNFFDNLNADLNTLQQTETLIRNQAQILNVFAEVIKNIIDETLVECNYLSEEEKAHFLFKKLVSIKNRCQNQINENNTSLGFIAGKVEITQENIKNIKNLLDVEAQLTKDKEEIKKQLNTSEGIQKRTVGTRPIKARTLRAAKQELTQNSRETNTQQNSDIDFMEK